MKILIISSLFPPNVYGGAEIVAYNFAISLVQKGHDVHVLTIKELCEEDCWAVGQKEGFTLYKLQNPKKHTLYNRSQINSTKEKFIWHLQDHFDTNNSKALNELLINLNPHHINIQNIMGFGFNALPFLANGKRSVTYVAHDFSLVCFKTTMYKNTEVCRNTCLSCLPSSFTRQYYFKKMQRVGVISPTGIHLQKLEKTFPYLKMVPRIVLHNSQPELPELPKHVQSEITKLIFVGRIDEIKGLEFLLKVLEGLANKNDFHLSIFGTGPEEEKLKSRYGNFKWVSFNGFVPSHQIPFHLIKADFYCIPSLWPEVYGMTTALSLKLGTPVIGSDIGGTSELIENGVSGILIAPNDINDWKSTLDKVFKNPSILKKIRKNLKESPVNEFSSNTIVNKFEIFLNEII